MKAAGGQVRTCSRRAQPAALAPQFAGVESIIANTTIWLTRFTGPATMDWGAACSWERLVPLEVCPVPLVATDCCTALLPDSATKGAEPEAALRLTPSAVAAKTTCTPAAGQDLNRTTLPQTGPSRLGKHPGGCVCIAILLIVIRRYPDMVADACLCCGVERAGGYLLANQRLDLVVEVALILAARKHHALLPGAHPCSHP